MVPGPDLQTAGEIPRYDIGNDHTPMKIALWIVNGAVSKEEEINAMMRGTNTNCRIITKTWLRSGRTLKCPCKTLRTDELPRPGRPAGGVAILLPQNMGAKIVRRYVQDELNALWVRIPNSVDVTAVYVRPGAERKAFRCFTDDVRRRARYPLVTTGDFNARHKVWCTKNNPNGKNLYDWSKKHGLQIANVKGTTFRSGRGSSNIDLFVCKNIQVSKPLMTDGHWNPASDHGAITTTLKPGNGRLRREVTVSTRSMANPENALLAAKHCEEHLPPVSKRFTQISSVQELEDTYKELKAVMLKPWLKFRGTRSGKYKSIWGGLLQRLSRQRGKSYRRALKLNDADSWKEHKRLDGKIKISVYRKKRALRTQEISAMLRISMPRTQSWIKKQIRGSNWDCNTTTTAGAPLTPADFTAHVCTKPGKVTMVAPKHFTVDENFQKNIEGTISRLPNGTAAGSDGIYYEMLKAATKETSSCLTALWLACGRTAHTPMGWRNGLLVPIYKKGDPDIPSNYRPICLRSSLRKVIERTLDAEMQAHYVPNVMQMGFQAKLGTEMAIAQTVQALKGGQKWTAVLDLKSAYDTVRRDLFF